MGIMKNNIPILEYDNDPKAVIMPDHEHIQMILPKKAVGYSVLKFFYVDQ